jgi:hypothetical protein
MFAFYFPFLKLFLRAAFAGAAVCALGVISTPFAGAQELDYPGS